MNNSLEIRKRILNQPDYWIEAINSEIYNLLTHFIEEKKLKKQDLAVLLGISAGRVSQLLNDGECNFNINTLIEISLKLGTFPVIKFENQQHFLQTEQKEKQMQSLFVASFIGADFGFETIKNQKGRPKIIKMFPQTNDSVSMRFNVNEFSICK